MMRVKMLRLIQNGQCSAGYCHQRRANAFPALLCLAGLERVNPKTFRLP